jgi:hypothetical protein
MPDIHCRKCGTIARPTDLYCRRCGAPLAPRIDAEDVAQDTKAEKGRQRPDARGLKSSQVAHSPRHTGCLVTAATVLSITLVVVVILIIALRNQSGGSLPVAIRLVGTSTPYPTNTPYFTATAYRRPTSYPQATPYQTTGILWQKYKVGCKLIIKNQNTSQDSVVILTDTKTSNPIAAVYVRANDSFTFTGFPAGTYFTYIAIGLDWDNSTSRFDHYADYTRFEEPDTFDACPSLNYGSYQYLEITLNLTEGEGSDTVYVQPDSFPSIAP